MLPEKRKRRLFSSPETSYSALWLTLISAPSSWFSGVKGHHLLLRRCAMTHTRKGQITDTRPGARRMSAETPPPALQSASLRKTYLNTALRATQIRQGICDELESVFIFSSSATGKKLFFFLDGNVKSLLKTQHVETRRICDDCDINCTSQSGRSMQRRKGAECVKMRGRVHGGTV